MHSHMVKYYINSKIGNPLPPFRGQLFLNNRQGIFYRHYPIDKTINTTAFIIPVVERGGGTDSGMSDEEIRSCNQTPQSVVLSTELNIAPALTHAVFVTWCYLL